ncbi:MAG: hypothetical protein EZS28_039975 [Streblomastix strix]|uniref:Uncharacterized protein n=1 Tax=Streblomastix strix TaxID=222440 RepID=A0A5J4U2C2_9EUKA|nr:MAG: hypothetical protein EZS28_039975 [Streblomastix strix]
MVVVDGVESARVDGDWFGSNPLVVFETEPEPINHSTSTMSGHMGLSLDGQARDKMISYVVVGFWSHHSVCIFRGSGPFHTYIQQKQCYG